MKLTCFSFTLGVYARSIGGAVVGAPHTLVDVDVTLWAFKPATLHAGIACMCKVTPKPQLGANALLQCSHWTSQ